MGLHRGVGAIEFDGLLKAGHGINGAAEDVAFGVAVDVASSLLKLYDLRLTLKAVEQEHSRILGQAKSGRDLGELRFFPFALLFDFFVELHSFRDRCSGGAIFFVLFGGGPVDQRLGKLLPFIALGAQVAYAVAFRLRIS